MRMYTDISHFRAPYKAWPIAGLGQEALVTTTTESGLVVVRDGVRYLTPEVASLVIGMINGMSVISLGGDRAVQLDVRVEGDPRPTAEDWMTAHLEAGRSIVIGSPAGIAAITTPTNVVRSLEAVDGLEGEKVAAGTNTLPLSAVLVQGTKVKKGSLPFDMSTLVVVGGVGLALLLIGGGFAVKRRRRATPNRRRRRRRSRRSQR